MKALREVVIPTEETTAPVCPEAVAALLESVKSKLMFLHDCFVLDGRPAKVFLNGRSLDAGAEVSPETLVHTKLVAEHGSISITGAQLCRALLSGKLEFASKDRFKMPPSTVYRDVAKHERREARKVVIA